MSNSTTMNDANDKMQNDVYNDVEDHFANYRNALNEARQELQKSLDETLERLRNSTRDNSSVTDKNTGYGESLTCKKNKDAIIEDSMPYNMDATGLLWSQYDYDELEDRLDAVKSDLHSDATIRDIIREVHALLDKLPASAPVIPEIPSDADAPSEDKDDEDCYVKPRNLLEAVRIVADSVHDAEKAVELASRNSESSLKVAALGYTALDTIRHAFDDIEVQNALMNPMDEYQRQYSVEGFRDGVDETLEILADSDSNVLNRVILSKWLDEFDSQIVGGLNSLKEPIRFREIDGRQVIL